MKRSLLAGIAAIVVIVGGVAYASAHSKKPQNTANTTQANAMRLGWQTPWATQGQLVQILKHTDTAKSNGLAIDFSGFDSGAPLNEAALAGKVDVLLTADQPAETLLSKNPDWVIIGRLMYNRVSLYVPPKSDISSVADLRGKTVAVPFGTAAQKMLLLSEKEAGLDPKADVTNTNLGIYEQSPIIVDAQASKWGSIDAMAGFDPTPAVFEQKGLVKMLKTDRVVSVIVMSKTYINNHPAAPKQFLTAFRQSYEYYRGHQSEANKWFVAESKLQVPEEALTASASIEPNIASDQPIRIGLNDDDLSRMQQTADFLYAQQLIKQKVIVKDFVDQSYQQ